MNYLSHHELIVFFLSLGVLLAGARTFGELARRFHQPAVLGEIIAGILLGPTVLGTLLPSWSAFIFPRTGGVPIAIDGLTTLSITLFLLVAGMEVELSTLWRRGRTAIIVGLGGVIIPFLLGFLTARYMPRALGIENGGNNLVFSFFFAAALSISALPVIVKILMDLKLHHTDLAMVIVAAAIFNDLVGWNVFSIIMARSEDGNAPIMNIGETILLTLGFTAFVLTVGRWALNRMLPWFTEHVSWPTGVLGFAIAAALFSAACTEWIGIHSIFGAFLFGIALGDSIHLKEKTRTTMDQFISSVFAPIFFASIGLRVNFITGFDIQIVGIVLLIATVGKVLGCGLGARLGGMQSREALAVGLGMNARGAMEIIFGLIALQAGIINEKMFVALVVMALVTSMTSGSLISRILGRGKDIDLKPGKENAGRMNV